MTDQSPAPYTPTLDASGLPAPAPQTFVPNTMPGQNPQPAPVPMPTTEVAVMDGVDINSALNQVLSPQELNLMKEYDVNDPSAADTQTLEQAFAAQQQQPQQLQQQPQMQPPQPQPQPQPPQQFDPATQLMPLPPSIFTQPIAEQAQPLAQPQYQPQAPAPLPPAITQPAAPLPTLQAPAPFDADAYNTKVNAADAMITEAQEKFEIGDIETEALNAAIAQGTQMKIDAGVVKSVYDQQNTAYAEASKSAFQDEASQYMQANGLTDQSVIDRLGRHVGFLNKNPEYADLPNDQFLRLAHQNMITEANVRQETLPIGVQPQPQQQAQPQPQPLVQQPQAQPLDLYGRPIPADNYHANLQPQQMPQPQYAQPVQQPQQQIQAAAQNLAQQPQPYVPGQYVQTPPRPEQSLPPLSAFPAAANMGVTDSRFGHLANMPPESLENSFAAMSPADQERFLSGAG